MIASKALHKTFTLKSGKTLRIEMNPITFNTNENCLSVKDKKEILSIVIKFYESLMSDLAC